MSLAAVDWAVLLGTLGAIVGYGIWKTRAAATDVADYLHGGYRDRWPTIGLSVMATQASAITFLSMPGQAYEDGMRFVQFYFGLPIAMVVLSAGITIYAPAIILSTVLGWSLNVTCVSIGALVIVYTVAGGTRAVSQTQ